MVDNSIYKNLTDFLCSLGLTREEALIYVSLSEHGTSTPLQLARYTGINRTKVYRTLDDLADKKLVIVEIAEHSTTVTAAPLERIEDMVRSKQQRVAKLAQNYPDMARMLASLGVQKQADTKVRFYRGKKGLEQMIWNVLKARSEIVGYTYRDLSDFVGTKFMDDFAHEFVRRNLTMRDIYGDEYRRSAHESQDWDGHIESRYLPDNILTIPHQMDIYDEVVSFYNWHEGEVFGVEIINPKVAFHQKQLFELVWEKAKMEPK